MNEELRAKITAMKTRLQEAVGDFEGVVRETGALDAYRTSSGMPLRGNPFDVCQNCYMQLAEVVEDLRKLELRLTFFEPTKNPALTSDEIVSLENREAA